MDRTDRTDRTERTAENEGRSHATCPPPAACAALAQLSGAGGARAGAAAAWWAPRWGWWGWWPGGAGWWAAGRRLRRWAVARDGLGLREEVRLRLGPRLRRAGRPSQGGTRAEGSGAGAGASWRGGKRSGAQGMHTAAEWGGAGRARACRPMGQPGGQPPSHARGPAPRSWAACSARKGAPAASAALARPVAAGVMAAGWGSGRDARTSAASCPAIPSGLRPRVWRPKGARRAAGPLGLGAQRRAAQPTCAEAVAQAPLGLRERVLAVLAPANASARLQGGGGC